MDRDETVTPGAEETTADSEIVTTETPTKVIETAPHGAREGGDKCKGQGAEEVNKGCQQRQWS